MTDNATNINKGVEQNTQKAAVELFSGSELVFSVIQTHKASLGAKITDNYIENNSAIHDHIAFSPILVTLSGLVGDIVLKSDAANQQAQDELAQARERQSISGNFFRPSNYLNTDSLVTTKLGTLFNLFPPMNNVMQVAVFNMSQAYISGKNAIIGRWNNKNNATLVSRKISDTNTIKDAYKQIQDTFYARLPNTVITPWATYKDMYIQNIEVTQDELNFIVDISVTFKQLKFSTVQYGEVDENVRSSYNAAAAADAENLGKSQMNSELYNTATPDFDYDNYRK